MQSGNKLIVAATLAACLTPSAFAVEYLLPQQGSVIGEISQTLADSSDTLLDVARRYNLGYEEIKLANPEVDPWLPGAGQPVVLPTRYVLPDAPRRGLVLNVAEMRLYYYPKKRRGQPRTVITHPVSIGRYDWATPLGRTKVVSKVRDPAWYPPASVRAEHAADGAPLPPVVPAGPDNPLGRHALLLGIKGYLIHGTNKPFGIGMRVSHGCVRMYPEDIEELFGKLPVGTPVYIVDEPVKVGHAADGSLVVEAHPRGGQRDGEDAVKDVYTQVDAVEPLLLAALDESTGMVDLDATRLALRRLSGMPVEVSAGTLAVAPEPAGYGPGGVVLPAPEPTSVVPAALVPEVPASGPRQRWQFSGTPKRVHSGNRTSSPPKRQKFVDPWGPRSLSN